jgi:two-component system, LytTR family, sensor histidine kinase AlgZ
MHPILARRGRLAPYLAGAVPLGGVLAAVLAGRGGFPLGEAVALAVPMMLLYAFLGLSAWYPCRALPLARANTLWSIATHLGASLVTSAVWVFLGAGIARLLAIVPGFAQLPARYASQVPAVFAVGVLLYLISSALHYVLLAFEQSREAERREAEMRVLAREAQLKALKAQLQPHFLFNSLNSVGALTTRDPAGAREMCTRLAEFLRKSLAVGESETIPVAEEISLARAYLAVEAMRFGPRLSIEEDVELEDGCEIPPLLLQPLVENAVRHGIATRVEGGAIRLEARQTGHRLRIVIENPCDPDTVPRRGSGLGLANVRERLTARYGSDAIFAAKRLKDRFLVVLSLPAQAGASG